MKILDYEFHRKFRRLLNWCEQSTDYVLNKAGIEKANQLLTQHVHRRPVNFLLCAFRIQYGYVITRQGVTYSESITSVAGLAQCFPHVGFDHLGQMKLVELILDTSNLKKFVDKE